MGVIEVLQEQAQRRGRTQGLAEGWTKGRTEERSIVASAMKKDGLPIEQIVRYTKLTEEDLRKL